jgi:hypothetical protein
MARIVTMHQPNYLPWIGLFSKICYSNCFVIADTSPFSRHQFTNRNKIRSNSGCGYLTIPINHRFYDLRICDVGLPSDKKWEEDHWKSIYNSYVHAYWFRNHSDFFKNIYAKDFQYLTEINMEIITYLLKSFEINVEIIRASDLNLDPSLQKTDLIVAAMKNVHADVYLSGPSGQNYLEVEKFPQNSIELKYSRFQHPVYPQRYPDFEPNMAAIDLLFNMGPRASEIIKASGSIEC